MAILTSGVSRLWGSRTHEFVLESLVICGHVDFSYNELEHMNLSPSEYRLYLDKLVNICIKFGKVKELLQTKAKK